MMTNPQLSFSRYSALAAALGVLCALTVSGQVKPVRPTPVSTKTLYAHVMAPAELPEYPERAATSGIKGVVRVRVVVSSSGATKSVEAVSGPVALRSAATDAVKSWTFIAVEFSGEPRDATGVVLLRFGQSDAGPSVWIVGVKGERVPVSASGQLAGGEPTGVPGGVPGGIPGGVPEGNPSLVTEGVSGRSPNDVPAPPEPWNPPADAHRASGGVLAGRAIERPQPAYPAMARAAGVEGAVVVEVVVGFSGRVIMARAISGHPLLRDAAVEAARAWVFEPTQLQGVTVKVIGTITFNFRKS